MTLPHLSSEATEADAHKIIREMSDAKLISQRAEIANYDLRTEGKQKHWSDKYRRMLDDEKASRFDALVTRIAELEQDRARLDWLESQDFNRFGIGGDFEETVKVYAGKAHKLNCREAIDAARKEVA
jgi:hypothetical protein